MKAPRPIGPPAEIGQLFQSLESRERKRRVRVLEFRMSRRGKVALVETVAGGRIGHRSTMLAWALQTRFVRVPEPPENR